MRCKSVGLGPGGSLLDVTDLVVEVVIGGQPVRVLNGVSFSVAPGETLGIVGESGSGKSMTALSILRLLPAAARVVGGTVSFEGRDLLKANEQELRRLRGTGLGIILQDSRASLNPLFTIAFQLAEPLRASGIGRSERKERIDDLLEMVQIPAGARRRVLESYPFQLSGGMRQRVAGAIAISRHPRLLIADEPTTSLDVVVQAEYLGLLRDLQHRLGFGMIFITHDISTVASVCDRLAVMYAGKLAEVGSAESVLVEPIHPYTQALIGSIPTIRDGLDRLVQIPGTTPSLVGSTPGCEFAPRCAYASARCTHDPPFMQEVLSGHSASCWHAEALLVELAGSRRRLPDRLAP